MKIDQWLKDSQKWMSEVSEKANQWMDQALTPKTWERFRVFDSSNESLTEYWKKTEGWIAEAWSQLKEQTTETIDGKKWNRFFQDAWEDLLESSAQTTRNSRALQTIFSIWVRYQFHEQYSRFLSAEEKTKRKEELDEQCANELTELCKLQGGAWVKAAQFLSCRSDLLPEVYATKLMTLQDQAPSVAWEQMEPLLVEQLGEQWRQRIAFIEEQPIASASIGQVHKATLPHGVEIALKLQKPEVSTQIHADLQFFSTVASWLQGYAEGIDLEQIMKELGKSIVQELDYYHESANLTQFESHYRSEHWEFPLLVKELIFPKLLGMHFVQGEPIREYLNQHPATATVILTELVRSFLKQIFLVGLFHADPHPGNFFVTAQHKIVLLDFGAIGKLSADEVTHYRQLVMMLILNNMDELSVALQKCGFIVPDFEHLRSFLEKTPQEWQGLSRFQYYLEVMKQTKVRIPDQFVLISRVLITLSGLLKWYQVSLDLQELAMQIFLENQEFTL